MVNFAKDKKYKINKKDPTKQQFASYWDSGVFLRYCKKPQKAVKREYLKLDKAQVK
jgi:hypothetical protein